MNDRAAFEQYIRENPQDEAPRLVYADWLEDHDEGELAAAMRRTTSEGQTTLGLMTWRDWDRWCLHLVPDAIEYIQIEWREVIEVIDAESTVIGGLTCWDYEIKYKPSCNNAVRTLICEITGASYFSAQYHSRSKFYKTDISPSELLSDAALEWARKKFWSPELVGVVEDRVVYSLPRQAIQSAPILKG